MASLRPSYLFMSAAKPIWPRIEAPKTVVEFRKVLNHPGIVFNEPIGGLAHLQLGRAYALSGDDTKARSAYQRFPFRSGKTPTPTSPS